MQYAITEDGKRVLPVKGAKALCAACSHPMLAACGDVYADHWRHIGANPHCESWKEKETAWHRAWKARFPAHWREIAVTKFGRRHIADVLTAQGTVIEFQNSSISVATIEAREDFYDDMIWVINIAEIAGHIRRRSHVNEAVRTLLLQRDGRMERIKVTAETTLLQEKGRCEEIKNRIGRLQSSRTFILSDIKRREEALLKTEATIANAVANWFDNIHYRLYEIAEPAEWEQKYKITLKELQVRKEKAEELLIIIKQHIAQLAAFERVYLEQKEYSIVPYSVLHEDNLSRLKIVLKEERHSLFLTGQTVTTMQELSKYKHQEKRYCFALDTSSTKPRLEQSCRSNEQIITGTEQQQKQLITDLGEEYKQLLELSLASYRKKLTDTDAEIEQYERDYIVQKLALERFISFHDDAVEKEFQQAEQEFSSKRYEAMKENKGSYSFHWKHRRKSWDNSYAQKYLDAGDGFLLKIFDNGTMHKIKIDDFINAHRIV